MNDKIKKIGIIIVVLGLMLTSTLGTQPRVFAISEEPVIESNVIYDENKTKADITLSVVNSEVNVINEIKDPAGNVMDVNNPVWSTYENGTYTFKVKYTKAENQEVTEIEKTVEVNGIGSKVAANVISDSLPKSELTFSIDRSKWAEKADAFVIMPRIMYPEGKSGGTITLHLPQYIKLNADIKGEKIDKVESTGSSNDEAGTTIVITLNEKTEGVFGQDVSISQTDFKKLSTQNEYKIKATYRDLENKEKVVEETFKPVIDYQSEATYSLPKGIFPDEKTLTFELTTEMNMENFYKEFSGYLVIPKEMKDFFNIEESQGTVDATGNLRIRIDETNKNNSKSLWKTLTINPNGRDIVAQDTKYYQYSMKFERDNQTTDEIKGVIGFYYPEMKTVVEYAPIDEKWIYVKDAYDQFTFGAGVYGAGSNSEKFSFAYIARDDQGKEIARNWAYKNLQKITNVTGSFILPEEYEHISGGSYDGGKREVSGIKASVFQYSNADTDYYNMQISGNAFIKAKKTMKNFNDFEVDGKIKFDYFGQEKVYKVRYPVTFSFRDPQFTMKEGTKGHEFKQGEKNQELFQIAWNKGGGNNKNHLAQKVEIPFYTYGVDIKKITFNPEVLKELTSLNVKFEYMRSGSSDLQPVDVNQGITINGEGSITKLIVTYDAYLGNPDGYTSTNSFATVYGDIKELDHGLVYHAAVNKVRYIPTDYPEKAYEDESGNYTYVVYKQTPKTDFIKSIIKDGPPSNIGRNEVNLSPGEIGKINVDMDNTFQLGQTKTETVDLQVDFTGLKQLQLMGLSNLFDTGTTYNLHRKVRINSITYTTNLHQEIRTFSDSRTNGYFDFSLPKGEYFTSLSININTKEESIYQPVGGNYFRITLMVKNPFLDSYTDTEESIKVFIKDDENYKGNSATYNDFILKETSDVTIKPGINNIQAPTNASLPVNDTFEISHHVDRNDKITGVVPDGLSLNKVVNPTYYYKIPRYYSYVKDSLKLEGNQFGGKTPSISVVGSDSVEFYYLKIQFYGDTASPTGIDAAIDKTNKISFSLKIEEYSKRGPQNDTIGVYEDVSNTLNAYNNKYLKVIPPKIGAIVVNNTSVSIASIGGISVKLTSLHSAQTILMGNVNTAKDALLRKEATIRSGEEFNAFLDVSNSGVSMKDFTMYIPVARSGRDDGNGTYEWDVQMISSALNADSNVTLQYSTNVNPTKNKLENKEDPNGMYVNAASIKNWEEVTMVKVIADTIERDKNISVTAKFKDRTAKTAMGEQKIAVSGYYSYVFEGSNKYVNGKTDPVNITLTDTNIAGHLFLDNNANGLLDQNDTFLSGKKVTLYDKDDNVIATDISKADGKYSFTVAAIPEGGYVKVEKMKGYSYTTYKKAGNPNSIISSFDPDTQKAYPDLNNSEELNAGFIETPDLIADQELSVKVKQSKALHYELIPANSSIKVQFTSADEAIAKVDSDGNVSGISTGTTTVRVYYESKVGTIIYADVEVTVESNDAPVINAPEEITMNVGDEWNPLDTTIIEGLSLSDDHDNVTIDDLSVIDTDLPIGDKFLFFFNTANTGKLTKAGTYEITYYYEDVDKNKTMKKVKVKINGQPYMTDADGNKLDTLPTLYYRIGTSLNQFDGIKAFWEKASDEIGEPPIVTEILPEDPNTGVFTLVESIDKDGNKVIGDPSEVGKYTGTFHVITPSTAKSIASISPKRELYARSQIQMSIHSIAYSSTATQKKFNDWNEFYNKFKDSLEITASVNTPDKDGNSITIDLFNNDSHNIKAITDISKLDFSLPDGMKSIDIPIEVEVSDSGKDSSLNADYGELKHRYTFHVTVQDVVGEAPHIHFKDIERIETDAIKKEATADSPDLSSDEAMKEAADKGEHPIYDKLITDLTLSDKETPADQIKVEILSIKRTSTPRNQSLKIEYDPNNEFDLRDMMKTIGTYEIVYQAIDGNENRVTATRVVKVAGKTIFVKDLSTFDPYDDVVTLMQRDHPYIPDGVFAYHMEYDEIGKDATVVHPMVSSVDISNPGTYEVSYYTTHHFGTYPMSDIKRPNDTVNQTIKVHGNVKFNEQENAIKEDFVGQTVDLNEIEATYLKASDTVGEVPVDTKLTLTNDINTSSYTANKPEEKSVTFSVKEGVVSGQLHVLYRFYDTPKITNISDGKRIEVKEDITENEIKDKIAAKASITKYDGNSIDLTNQITYDFSDIKDSKVMIQVEYTLSNGKKAIDTKTVYIDRVKKATITASDIVYNVNDTIDLKKDSNLSINDQSGEVDLNKVRIKGEVPEHMGTASKAGTYKITFSYEDHVGNVAETDILVKVHGLPVISGINDMEKRVGDDFKVWDNIEVTYEKAPDQEGPATLETFTYANANDIGAKLELKDMKDEISGKPVSFDSINTPGYYSGIYYAETPNKAKAELKRTLLLHGQPQISANNITISINVGKPDDFISEFKDELNLKASVIHAYKDKAPEEVDLIKNVTIKSNTIAYGTPGTYKVEFEVQDNSLGEALYANKLYNIDVTVAVIAGDPPTITTPDRHRVENDPIGINDSGRVDVVKYLTEAPIYDETNKNTVKSKDLISVKINGQTELNNPSDDQLLNMLDTVGVHEVKIQVTDSRDNIITVSQYWHVAGVTEFGILKEPGNENTFEKITDIYNVRQSIGENFHNSGIRARHLDPDGTYHYMPIDQNSDHISLDAVGRHEVTISATHHYAVYEDDANQKRTKDSLTFYLLVQGRIKFSKIDDIYTREGTSVDPLKNANEDGTYTDITATFEMVHKDGTITTENASLSATYVDTSTIGKRAVELTAKEQLSGVNNYAETYQRNVYVYSIPNIDYNPGFNVGKDATLNDLKNGLAAVITYRDDKGNTLPVQAQDIEINYDEVLKEIQGKGPGKSYPITITVSYMDNGQKKQIVKTANVYVLNDPSVIVQIPKYIELKDDGNGDIEASPEVQLYDGNDKDDQKINVPKVNIYVDSSVVLRKGTDEFTAQTYKKDNQPYTNPALPILELEYGKLEKDHFYLKADKAAIPKNIGVYQGLLNFTMEYEGD